MRRSKYQRPAKEKAPVFIEPVEEKKHKSYDPAVCACGSKGGYSCNMCGGWFCEDCKVVCTKCERVLVYRGVDEKEEAEFHLMPRCKWSARPCAGCGAHVCSLCCAMDPDGSAVWCYDCGGDQEEMLKRIGDIRKEYREKEKKETAWKSADFCTETLKCKKPPTSFGVVTWNVNHLSWAQLTLPQLAKLGVTPSGKWVMGFTGEDLESEGISKTGSHKYQDIDFTPPEKERKVRTKKLNADEEEAVERVRSKLTKIDELFKNPAIDMVALQEIDMTGLSLLHAWSQRKECPWEFLNIGPLLATTRETKKGDTVFAHTDRYPMLVRKGEAHEKRFVCEDVKVLVEPESKKKSAFIDPGPIYTYKDDESRTEGEGYRPIVAYKVEVDGKAFWLGVVHTSPSGNEGNRKKLYESQVEQWLKIIQKDIEKNPDNHWILLGDWYLQPETVTDTEGLRGKAADRNLLGKTFEKKMDEFKIKDKPVFRGVYPLSGSNFTGAPWDKSETLPQQADFSVCSSNIPTAVSGLVSPDGATVLYYDEGADALFHIKGNRSQKVGGTYSDHAPVAIIVSLKPEDSSVFKAFGFTKEKVSEISSQLGLIDASRYDEIVYLQSRQKMGDVSSEELDCIAWRLNVLLYKPPKANPDVRAFTPFDVFPTLDLAGWDPPDVPEEKVEEDVPEKKKKKPKARKAKRKHTKSRRDDSEESSEESTEDTKEEEDERKPRYEKVKRRASTSGDRGKKKLKLAAPQVVAQPLPQPVAFPPIQPVILPVVVPVLAHAQWQPLGQRGKLLDAQIKHRLAVKRKMRELEAEKKKAKAQGGRKGRATPGKAPKLVKSGKIQKSTKVRDKRAVERKATKAKYARKKR